MTDCRGGVDDSTGCRGGDGVATRRPARAEEATRLASGRHGKPSRPHESWIPSAWKKKGSELRPSDGWAAKVRKNLARWRLARGRQPRENAGIPPGKRAAKVGLRGELFRVLVPPRKPLEINRYSHDHYYMQL